MFKIVDGTEVEMTPEEEAEFLSLQQPEFTMPAPASASKLGLIRAFREAGTWPAIKAAIAANDTMQEDWDAAQEIRRTDPLTQAMIAQLGLDDVQVDALLTRAAELVA